MKVEFHPAAREEFVAAAEFYDAAVAGIGSRFLLAVQRTTQMVLTHPEAGARRGTHARQWPVSGFPYAVIYRVRGDMVEILAIAHQHRRPGYWRDRLP